MKSWTREPIDTNFGPESKLLPRGDKLLTVRPKEYQELVNLWKRGLDSRGELEQKLGRPIANLDVGKELHTNLEKGRKVANKTEKMDQRGNKNVQHEVLDKVLTSLQQEKKKEGQENEVLPAEGTLGTKGVSKPIDDQLYLHKALSSIDPNTGISSSSSEYLLAGEHAPNSVDSVGPLPTTSLRDSTLSKPHYNEAAGSPAVRPVDSESVEGRQPSRSEKDSSESADPPSIIFGTQKITSLLRKLSAPQEKLKVIHVAGTNGKGSVCAYLTESLIASGLRVGRFTSPHLIDRWDCITINNEAIPDDKFHDLENHIRTINDIDDINASPFEILTACAITYFAEQNIDIAVIETGMGGLLDATNVFDSPLVSIITSISLDHTQYLGSTVEEIAKHKAGIIKTKCPVVTIPHPPQIHEIISEAADAVDAPLYIASGHWRSPAQTRYLVEDVRFTDIDPLSTPVLSVVPGISGTEQASNVACAVKALCLLHKAFPSITEEAVQKGIASTSLPGRLEWIRFELNEGKIPMLLDGAHNPASFQALADFVAPLRRDGPVIWILAFSQGRDYRLCMSKIVKKGDSVACVEFGNVEGMGFVRHVNAEDLAEEAKLRTGSPQNVMNFGKDLRGVIRWAVAETKGRKGMLVATGSLYLVGDIHRLRRFDADFG